MTGALQSVAICRRPYPPDKFGPISAVRQKKGGPKPALSHSSGLSSGSTAQIDDGAPVLRFAHARSGGHERIVEALAFDRDRGAVHALARHFVFDCFGATHRKALVVTVHSG